MTWGAPLSAVAGAIIALASTLLVDIRRERRSADREHLMERRRHCIAFTVALVDAHGTLRNVARQGPNLAQRELAAVTAVGDVYPAREQVLTCGTPRLILGAESVFHHLVAVRDVIRKGATLESKEYHDAYHPFAQALWEFRLAIRSDLREPALAPQDLGLADWSDRDRCATCQGQMKQNHS
jgi:hypothetical protein